MGINVTTHPGGNGMKAETIPSGKRVNDTTSPDFALDILARQGFSLMSTSRGVQTTPA